MRMFPVRRTALFVCPTSKAFLRVLPVAHRETSPTHMGLHHRCSILSLSLTVDTRHGADVIRRCRLIIDWFR